MTSRNKGVHNETPTEAEALTQSLEEISSRVGRLARGNNLVLGSNDSEEKWRQLDEQVNSYPGPRYFKAIGVGGKEFEEAMVAAVEQVVGRVHEECVSMRPSSGGKYVSVTVGPVMVTSADEVIAVYANMKADTRLKFFI